jgi:hypothetical protein
MRLIFFILLIFFIKPLFAQQFYSKQIGWTVSIPDSFISTNSHYNDSVQKEGKKILEQTNDIKIDDRNLKDLISISKGELNYFNATLRRYDLKKEGNYDIATEITNKMTYKALLSQLPDNRIDSMSKKDTIDGVIFSKFELTVFLEDNWVMTMVVMSKFYKGFDFGITYFYTDVITKEEIETMLYSSKFSK